MNPEQIERIKNFEERQKRTKSKNLIIILVISLILNIALGIWIYYKSNNTSYHEQRFVQECTFAEQKFRSVKTSSDIDYLYAVSCLRNANSEFSRIGDINKNRFTHEQQHNFYKLWDYSINHSEQVIENIDKIVAVLSKAHQLIYGTANDVSDFFLKLEEVIIEIENNIK